MAKAASTADQAPPSVATPRRVGPPLLILGLGFASSIASLPLVAGDGVAVHAVGYLVGAMIPVLVVGLVRRIDLDRRRSPYYQPSGLFRPGLVVLAIVAIVAAGLHVWPIATELAS
jgi:hypothetical protein